MMILTKRSFFLHAVCAYRSRRFADPQCNDNPNWTEANKLCHAGNPCFVHMHTSRAQREETKQITLLYNYDHNINNNYFVIAIQYIKSHKTI